MKQEFDTRLDSHAEAGAMVRWGRSHWVGVAALAVAPLLPGVATVGWSGLYQVTPPLMRPGDIVVANLGDHSVPVFDGETGELRGYVNAPRNDTIIRNPTGVAFGPDGHLYVASSGNGRIVRFDGRSGAYAEVVAAFRGGGVPMGMALTGSGRLLIGDFRRARVYSVDLSRSRPAELQLLVDTGLNQPDNVAVKPVRQTSVRR